MPYPLEIVKKSRELLAERREKATSEAIERRMAVAKRAPRALEIEREISTTSARLASAVLSGEDVAAQVRKIREFNLQKQRELSEALRSGGFPPEDVYKRQASR